MIANTDVRTVVCFFVTTALFKMQSYLYLPIEPHRTAVSRFLTSCHELAIEVLRKPCCGRRIQQEDRLCRFCKRSVETEVHATIQCCASNDLIDARE